MKKELDYEEALQVLKRGESVICQLSNREDNTETVHSEDRLSYLHNLSKRGTQMCKIYRIPQVKIDIPNDAIEISFDEAYEMVAKGELVYYKEDGEEEEITTIAELISIRKKYELRGYVLLLYWHE